MPNLRLGLFLKSKYSALIKMFVLLAPFVFSPQAFAATGGEISDSTKVVSLSPSDIPALKDRNPQSFSLATVRNGRLVPIPFQIDEQRETGFIFMKARSKKEKKKDPIVGKELFFDGNDEFLFMFRDAGNRLKNMMRVDGELISEIQLDNYKGEKKYVYLIKDAVRESEVHYVRFSSELGRVETDFYALKVDPKNAFMWEEFYFDSFVGAKSGRPVDTIKLRMYSKALAAIPLNLSNKHMIAKVVAEKSGPIRSTTEYKVVLTLFKSPVMKFDLQIVHHEHSISYNSRVFIPALRRRMVSKAAQNTSVDFIDLLGAEVTSSAAPTLTGIIDGETSDIEKEMKEVTFKVNEGHWIFMGTDNGFSVLQEFRVDTKEDLPIGLVYEENKDVDLAPEYFKGQMPMLGFFMHRTPMKGFMGVTNSMSMYSEPINMEPAKFEALVNRDLNIKVSKLK